MFKIALKHWIYELCIHVLFENIYKFFKKNRKSFNNLRTGQHLTYVLTRYIRYEDSIVVKVTNGSEFCIKERVVYIQGRVPLNGPIGNYLESARGNKGSIIAYTEDGILDYG